MSHKDLNPVNRKNPKRVAIVLSNPVVSTTTGWPAGLTTGIIVHYSQRCNRNRRSASASTGDAASPSGC